MESMTQSKKDIKGKSGNKRKSVLFLVKTSCGLFLVLFGSWFIIGM